MKMQKERLMKPLILLLLTCIVHISYAQRGGGGTPTIGFTGPTSVNINDYDYYYVSVSGATHNSSSYTVSGGTIISQSLTNVRIKWTSVGSGRSVNAYVQTSGGSELKTVTVNVICPGLNSGSIGNSQTVCYNGNASAFTNTASPSGGDGNYSYQWQYQSGSSWLNVSGATSSTYDPPALTSTRVYRRRAYSCGQYAYSNWRTITVYSNLNAGSINNVQTLCYNGNPSTLGSSASASGSNGGYVYQWQYSTNGSSGWTNISGATGTTYNPGALTSSRWYRRRVKANSCSGYKYTNTVKVTIYSNLNAGSINNAQTLCYNGNPSTLGNSASASGSNGGYVYQWQYSTNGSSGWTNISGATGTTYNPGALTSSLWYRRRVKANSCSAYKYTNTVKVTIYSNLSAGSINNAQTLCYNGNPATLGSSASASGSNGGYVYQWQYSSNGSSGWTDISGATGTTFDPGALTSDRWYRRRVKANSCSNYAYTSSVKVTIYSVLNAGSIEGDQILCYNENPTVLGSVSSASGSNGGYIYQWQDSPDNNNWSDISGATETTYDPEALTSDRWYRRRVKANSCSNYVYTGSVKITIYSELSAGSIDGIQSVCHNEDPSMLGSTGVATGGAGSYSYQWQYSTDGSTGWIDMVGESGTSYDPGVLTADRWYRRRVESGSCAVYAYTDIVKVTSYSELNPGAIDGEQTLCHNEISGLLGSVTPASGSNGTYSYQWQSSSDGTTGWTDVVGETGLTFLPVTQTSDRWYRRRAVASSCSDQSFTGIVKITALAEVPVPTLNSIVYSFEETTVIPSTPPADEIWYWQTTAFAEDESNSFPTLVTSNPGEFYLRAKNTNGCWSDALVTVLEAQEPVTLSISPLSNESIEISWSGVSGNETGFKISRATSPGGTYSEIYSAAPTDTIYTDTGLSTGTNYYYRIQGVVGAQLSTGTQVATATTSPEFNGDETLVHKPVYNGNISAIRWKGYNDESEQVFTYLYDGLNRLTKAHYAAEAISTYGRDMGYYSVPNINYDLNGNILNLTRQGFNTSNSPDIIDELTYSYASGNQLTEVSDTRSEAGFKDGTNTGNDYMYDANGNMIKDLNKGIDTIHYNYLNLPIRVNFEIVGDSITYLYDAAGIKLQQKVYEGGSLVKTTDYVGGHIYENDTLQLVQHEEGRIVPKWNVAQTAVDDWDYQYHLKDHLGNVRLTFSTTPENYTMTEDFEGGLNGFQDLHQQTDFNANTTQPYGSNDKVGLLQSGQTGAMVFLSLNKGDTVDLSVKVNYETTPSGNSFLGTAYSALFSSFDGSFGSGVDGGVSSSSTVFDDALAGTDMANKSNSSTAPRAFLNYIIFDQDMSYVSAGFTQISTAALRSVAHDYEQISLNEIIADQEGYILAYLSNENTEAANIFFDDFEVYHGKTNVVFASDYYPFGLSMGEYMRTASSPQNYRFNGGSEWVDNLGMYMTRNRMYDPATGRFRGIDALADMFPTLSPMLFSYNNPIMFFDPLGLSGEKPCPEGVDCSGATVLDEVVVTAKRRTKIDYVDLRSSRNPIHRAIGRAHQSGDRNRMRNFTSNKRLHFSHGEHLKEQSRESTGDIWQKIAAAGIGGSMIATAGSPILISNLVRSGAFSLSGSTSTNAILGRMAFETTTQLASNLAIKGTGGLADIDVADVLISGTGLNFVGSSLVGSFVDVNPLGGGISGLGFGKNLSNVGIDFGVGIVNPGIGRLGRSINSSTTNKIMIGIFNTSVSVSAAAVKEGNPDE